jgi:hypothetical protein
MMICSLTIGWCFGLLASFGLTATLGLGIISGIVIFMIVGNVATLATAAALVYRAETSEERSDLASVPLVQPARSLESC